MTDKKKWFCTDCDDIFTDETGERCPSCGFRRVVGPVKYLTAAECRDAIWKDMAVTNRDQRRDHGL